MSGEKTTNLMVEPRYRKGNKDKKKMKNGENTWTAIQKIITKNKSQRCSKRRKTENLGKIWVKAARK